MSFIRKHTAISGVPVKYKYCFQPLRSVEWSWLVTSEQSHQKWWQVWFEYSPAWLSCCFQAGKYLIVCPWYARIFNYIQPICFTYWYAQELDDGKIELETLYFLIQTMLSCRFAFLTNPWTFNQMGFYHVLSFYIPYVYYIFCFRTSLTIFVHKNHTV